MTMAESDQVDLRVLRERQAKRDRLPGARGFRQNNRWHPAPFQRAQSDDVK